MEQSTPLDHAGFGPRFLAFGIDFIIFMIGIMILAMMLDVVGLKLLPDTSGQTFEDILHAYESNPARLRAYNMTLMGLNILYYSYFESSIKQATPGKQLIKIKVINPTGEGLTLQQALLRNAGKIVSQLILYIGFFMCLFTSNKQCLHDIFAGSYVIKND